MTLEICRSRAPSAEELASFAVRMNETRVFVCNFSVNFILGG